MNTRAYEFLSRMAFDSSKRIVEYRQGIARNKNDSIRMMYDSWSAEEEHRIIRHATTLEKWLTDGR